MVRSKADKMPLGGGDTSDSSDGSTITKEEQASKLRGQRQQKQRMGVTLFPLVEMAQNGQQREITRHKSLDETEVKTMCRASAGERQKPLRRSLQMVKTKSWKERRPKGDGSLNQSSTNMRDLLVRSTSEAVLPTEIMEQTSMREKRKAALERYASRTRLDAKKLARPKTAKESSDKPTSFMELLMRESSFSNMEPMREGPQRSCLRKQQQQQPAQERTSKSVQFATNAKNGKVWTMVRMIDMVSESDKSALWWTEEEFDQRYYRDIDLAALVDSEYSEVLEKLFESARQEGATGTAQLCFSAMDDCDIARGLELEVWSGIRSLKVEHRKAVLDAQALIRDEEPSMPAQDMHSLLRDVSLVHTTPNQFVSQSIAQYDAVAMDRD